LYVSPFVQYGSTTELHTRMEPHTKHHVWFSMEPCLMICGNHKFHGKYSTRAEDLKCNGYRWFEGSKWCTYEEKELHMYCWDSSLHRKYVRICIRSFIVPHSCTVSKCGTQKPVKRNHPWYCGEPCKFTHGIVKLLLSCTVLDCMKVV